MRSSREARASIRGHDLFRWTQSLVESVSSLMIFTGSSDLV